MRVKKAETLRGRGVFRSVARTGMRVDGTYLRAYALVTPSSSPSFVVGVTVYGRGFTAVRRNRIRRRLRAAVDRERGRIRETVQAAAVRLELVLGYRSPAETPIAPFTDLHEDCVRVLDRTFTRMQAWSR